MKDTIGAAPNEFFNREQIAVFEKKYLTFHHFEKKTGPTTLAKLKTDFSTIANRRSNSDVVILSLRQ